MRVRNSILQLVPYQPGKPIEETQRELGLNHVVKLASNENPFGISPAVIARVKDCLSGLNRYPDASCHRLKVAMAQRLNVSPAELTFGNGSNELIDLLIRVLCLPAPDEISEHVPVGDHLRTDLVATFSGAFVAYEICAQAAGVGVLKAPLDKNYKFDLNQMLHFLDSEVGTRVRLLFLPNPNNPTGTYISQSELQGLLSRLQSHPNLVVVLDEAYLEYVRAEDFIDGLRCRQIFKRVAVLRTFSKVYGLAGLRLGALVADPELIGWIDRVRNLFNVSQIAQEAAVAALEDREFVAETLRKTWAGLDWITSQLDSLGLEWIPSQGNFVLFDTGREALSVYQALLKKGVILRPVASYGFPRHLRFTVGTPEENSFAILALRTVLGKA